MKLLTFYKIFYRHRIVKANFFLKIYLIIILPFRYLSNLPFVPKKINLDDHSISNSGLFKKNLDYLFEKFNSDKGNFYINQYSQPIKKKNTRISAHGYAEIYEKYFLLKKNDHLNILEIGSFYGNAAAALYYYFKNSKIYSADIFPDLFRYSSERVENFYVDSSSENSLKNKLISKNIFYDIIIEDASHSFKDQIISLFMLFKKVSPKGLFIIEELDFPEKRKDMNLKNEYPSLKQILIDIKNSKNFDSKYINDSDKKYFLDNFKTIQVFNGKINEIAIIEKK